VSALEIAAFGLLAVAGYLAWCWFWPFVPCRACTDRGGRGRLSTRYGYNRCWRCGGSRERVKVAARIISSVTGWKVRGSQES
jgi:hypothetical protein